MNEDKKPKLTLALVAKRLNLLIAQVRRIEERIKDLSMQNSDLEDRMIVVEDTISGERGVVFESDWDPDAEG